MEKMNKSQTTQNAKKAFSDLTSILKSDTKETVSLQDKYKGESAVKNINNDFNAQSDFVNATKEVKPISIISKNTEISGNINTKGDLEIAGYIEGNVKVSGKVTVVGAVKGDIEAEELIVKVGKVSSQTIIVKKTVIIEENSDITGNINCEYIIANAKITGNIVASQKCELQACGVVEGDIQAKELSVQTGAVLIGKVDITRGKIDKKSTPNTQI